MIEASDMSAVQIQTGAESSLEPSKAAAAARVNLLGMSQAQLEGFFLGIGEKRFRAAQVLKWIHQLGVVDFAQMSNISKDLRQKLAEVAEITFPVIQREWDSADGCRKFLLRVEGG